MFMIFWAHRTKLSDEYWKCFHELMGFVALTLVMSISSIVMNLWAYRTDFGDGDCKCFHEFMGLWH